MVLNWTEPLELCCFQEAAHHTKHWPLQIEAMMPSFSRFFSLHAQIDAQSSEKF